MTAKTLRGKQAKPTRAELNSCWQLLREKASDGDVQASALLIMLAEKTAIFPNVQINQGVAP